MVVVVPLYKDNFTAFEKRNLANTFRLLKDSYDICILCPKLLRTDFIKNTFGFSPQYLREASVYFSGKNAYSRLMERHDLYDRFSEWDYMLIVQADVWLFNHTSYQIEDFLDKNPVYMGALWHEDYSKTIGMNGVTCGNGGLSLRNTKKIANLLRTSKYKNERLKTVEDQYISYIIYNEKLMTSEDDAFGFSVDNYPDYWLKRFDGKMPMGAHMSKNEWRELWKPYVEHDMKLAGITDTYTDDILEETISEWKDRPEIVVSLTSFGERLKNDAEIVIQNMMRIQSIKPDKIVLSIYKDDEKNLTQKMLDFERTGKLEIIRWEENLRPHLKYYPAMLRYPDSCIVTVDDDIIYSRDMLKNLLTSYRKHPDCISAMRCHKIVRDANGMPRRYNQWVYQCLGDPKPSDDLFATGVGGVLYPPGVFRDKMDTEQMKCFITADDIYLKVLEHALGIKIVTAYNARPKALMNIKSESSKSNRLCDINTIGKTLNDEYLKTCDLRPDTFGKPEAFITYKKEQLQQHNERKVVYTCISGNYDVLDDPRVVTPGWEYICFTDQPIQSKVWEIRPLPDSITSDKTLNQIKRQRIVKIRPWDFIGDCDVCVWVDANLLILGDMDEFVKQHDGDLVTTKHPDRDCIYDEALAIVKYRKDNMTVMQPQIDFYKADGYPAHAGLCETNVIIRRKTDDVQKVMDMWSELLRKHSHRDQMSFNYVIWKLGYKLKMFSAAERNKFFKYRAHRKNKK